MVQLIATDLSEHYKLSSIIYNVIYALHDTTGFKSQWLDNVKSLICSLGFAGVWYSQSFSNINWFVKACNQNLKILLSKTGLEKSVYHLQVTFIEFLKQSSNKAIVYLFCLPITVNVSWLLGRETIG